MAELIADEDLVRFESDFLKTSNAELYFVQYFAVTECKIVSQHNGSRPICPDSPRLLQSEDTSQPT